jgi:hypothetical protein
MSRINAILSPNMSRQALWCPAIFATLAKALMETGPLNANRGVTYKIKAN